MKYAVIKSGGKQYKVSEGEIIDVDRLDTEKDASLIFDNVLLLVSDSKVKIGNPIVSGVKVKAKALAQTKGEKIKVSKFKSKVRYRQTKGFRAALTRVQIEKIEEKQSKTE